MPLCTLATVLIVTLAGASCGNGAKPTWTHLARGSEGERSVVREHRFTTSDGRPIELVRGEETWIEVPLRRSDWESVGPRFWKASIPVEGHGGGARRYRLLGAPGIVLQRFDGDPLRTKAEVIAVAVEAERRSGIRSSEA